MTPDQQRKIDTLYTQHLNALVVIDLFPYTLIPLRACSTNGYVAAIARHIYAVYSLTERLRISDTN